MTEKVEELDQLIWKKCEGNDIVHLKAAEKILNEPDISVEAAIGNFEIPSPDQFNLPEGFEFILFSSEVGFSLRNQIKIIFDHDGRLCVSSMPSCLHYL